jgi:hypothetical protein
VLESSFVAVELWVSLVAYVGHITIDSNWHPDDFNMDEACI